MKKQIIAILGICIFVKVLIIFLLLVYGIAHAQTVGSTVTLPQNSLDIRVYWNVVVDTGSVGYKVYLKYKNDPAIPYPVNDTTLVFQRTQIRDSTEVYVSALDMALNESAPSPAVLVRYETVPVPPNPPGEYLTYRIDDWERIELNYGKIGACAKWIDSDTGLIVFAWWGYQTNNTIILSTIEKMSGQYRISINGKMSTQGKFYVLIGGAKIPVALSTANYALTVITINVPVAGEYSIQFQSEGADVLIESICYQRGTEDHTPPLPVNFIRIENWVQP